MLFRISHFSERLLFHLATVIPTRRPSRPRAQPAATRTGAHAFLIAKPASRILCALAAADGWVAGFHFLTEDHRLPRRDARCRQDGFLAGRTGSRRIYCMYVVEAAYALLQGASMITFACSTCQKKFSVKDELGGKKGKCPGCGQLVAIPSPVGSAAAAEMPTLPPSPGPKAAGQDKRTNSATHPPSSDPDATQDVARARAGHDASLTDFLAPSQADDELGRLGNYRVLKILGHGGMGVVFKAEDPMLKRCVAIKAMLPNLAASARRRPTLPAGSPGDGRCQARSHRHHLSGR